MLFFGRKRFDSVAQLVEQYTFNVWVLGPSPSGITKGIRKYILFLYNSLTHSGFQQFPY